MFTGIIESLGEVKKITKKTNSILLNVESDIITITLTNNGLDPLKSVLCFSRSGLWSSGNDCRVENLPRSALPL